MNDGASDLIDPLLPLDLTSVLMAGPRALCLIEGIAEPTSSLLKLASGALSDRSGSTQPWIVAGYGGYGLLYLLIAHLHGSGACLLLLMVSYGLALSATEGVEKALVADLSLPGQRGAAFGWFNLITGVTVLPASLVFGWLSERFSPELAFTAGGLCALAAALWLSRLPWNGQSSVHPGDRRGV